MKPACLALCIISIATHTLNGMDDYQLPLTNDVWVHIFSFLSVNNQINLATTCKAFKHIFDTRAVTTNCTINLNKAAAAQKVADTKNMLRKFVPILPAPDTPIIEHICKKIEQNQISGSVRFKNDKANNSDLEQIFISLKLNSLVTALDLDKCETDDAELYVLASTLRQSKINLNSLRFHRGHGHDVISALLKITSSLEELNCRGSNILVTRKPTHDVEAYEIDVVTRELTKRHNSFYFRHKKEDDVKVLGTDKLTVLGDPFFKLKSINLSNCALVGAHHIEWIITILQKNKNLQTLILQKNKLHTDQQKHLELRKTADAPECVLTLLDLSKQDESKYAQEILPYGPTRADLKILLLINLANEHQKI